MDGSVVVFVDLILLVGREAAHGVLEVAVCVLGADHEANLAGWVGRDSGVGVLNVREDVLAVLLELSDEWEVEPWAFG